MQISGFLDVWWSQSWLIPHEFLTKLLILDITLGLWTTHWCSCWHLLELWMPFNWILYWRKVWSNGTWCCKTEFISATEKQQPNEEAQKLYDIRKTTQQPLWKDCSTHTKLSTVVRIISIKTKYNILWDYFNNLQDCWRKQTLKKI